MGTVCDLLHGMVEIPCHTRNGAAAASAFVNADLVLGGYTNYIPLDETIDAVYAVGLAMPKELRCTSKGGLAVTPSALAPQTRDVLWFGMFELWVRSLPVHLKTTLIFSNLAHLGVDLGRFAHVMLHGIVKCCQPDVLPHFLHVPNRLEIECQVEVRVAQNDSARALTDYLNPVVLQP